MKNIFKIFLLIALTYNAYGTAQEPESIIYNNQFCDLYSLPLEYLFDQNNSRPKDLFKGNSPDLMKTSCTRLYHGCWIIEDGKLFLLDISPNPYMGSKIMISKKSFGLLKKCLPKRIHRKIASLVGTEFSDDELERNLKRVLSEKEFNNYWWTIHDLSQKEISADLKELFPLKYKDGRVFADWFTGILPIQQGEWIDSIRNDIFCVYNDKEVLLEINNGIVTNSALVNHTLLRKPENMEQIINPLYSIFIPDKFTYNPRAINKNVVTLTSDSIMVHIQVNRIQERIVSKERKVMINQKADSIIKDNIYFRNAKIKEFTSRLGNGIYLESYENSLYRCIIIIKDIHSEFYLYYSERNGKKKAKTKMDDIRNSIILNEFPINGSLGY